MSQIAVNVKTIKGVTPKPPSGWGYPNHTLLKLYFKDIDDSLAKFPRIIALENDMKMITECPRLQEIGVNF